MGTICAACVRLDLGSPNSVESLAASVVGMVENSDRFERAETSVGDLTAELTAKYATIVGLESELAAQAATLDERVDSVQAKVQDRRVTLKKSDRTVGRCSDCPCGIGSYYCGGACVGGNGEGEGRERLRHLRKFSPNDGQDEGRFRLWFQHVVLRVGLQRIVVAPRCCVLFFRIFRNEVNWWVV